MTMPTSHPPGPSSTRLPDACCLSFARRTSNYPAKAPSSPVEAPNRRLSSSPTTSDGSRYCVGMLNLYLYSQVQVALTWVLMKFIAIAGMTCQRFVGGSLVRPCWIFFRTEQVRWSFLLSALQSSSTFSVPRIRGGEQGAFNEMGTMQLALEGACTVLDACIPEPGPQQDQRSSSKHFRSQKVKLPICIVMHGVFRSILFEDPP